MKNIFSTFSLNKDFKYDVSQEEDFIQIIESQKPTGAKIFRLSVIWKVYDISFNTFTNVCNLVKNRANFISLLEITSISSGFNHVDRTIYDSKVQKTNFSSYYNGLNHSFDNKPATINYSGGRICYQTFSDKGKVRSGKDNPGFVRYFYVKDSKSAFKTLVLHQTISFFYENDSCVKEETVSEPGKVLQQRLLFDDRSMLHCMNGPAKIAFHNGKYIKYYYYHNEFIGQDLPLTDSQFEEFIKNREILK